MVVTQRVLVSCVLLNNQAKTAGLLLRHYHGADTPAPASYIYYILSAPKCKSCKSSSAVAALCS